MDSANSTEYGRREARRRAGPSPVRPGYGAAREGTGSRVEVRPPQSLSAGASTEERLCGLLGASPSMKRLFATLRRVGPTRATVLITGETGTGKELVAQSLHCLSPRKPGEFVPVVCSALAGSLLESELFGFVKGAFTGATESRMGLIERAGGGTLFLDEISTLSPDMQVKLLRVIQDRKIQRVGGRTLQEVDFRLVAATNRDLTEMVSEGDFREDLFYRLNVFPVRVPPLRDRPGDILLLADHFRHRFARELGMAAPPLPGSLLARMRAYPWPGNVRELEGFMERLVILSDGGVPPDFQEILGQRPSVASRRLVRRASANRWTLERLEREYILATLRSTGGNRTAAARRLGISRRTLHRRLDEYRAGGLLTQGSGEADRDGGVDLDQDGDAGANPAPAGTPH